MGQIMDEASEQADGVLLGRKTYEILAAHWPNVSDDDDPLASKLNSVPKHVASTTLETVEWNNSTLLKGDIAEGVANLKEQPGTEIQVIGSWQLIQTLIKHDLVDEI